MSDELVQRLRDRGGDSKEDSALMLDAADEIERLRAEVATVRTDAHDALCDERAARERAESALAALRKRVEESPHAVLTEGPPGRGYLKAHISRIKCDGVELDKRVALVVLGDG